LGAGVDEASAGTNVRCRRVGGGAVGWALESMERTLNDCLVQKAGESGNVEREKLKKGSREMRGNETFVPPLIKVPKSHNASSSLLT
jgi:hypothetical protein